MQKGMGKGLPRSTCATAIVPLMHVLPDLDESDQERPARALMSDCSVELGTNLPRRLHGSPQIELVSVVQGIP